MFQALFKKPVPAISPDEVKCLLAKDKSVLLLDVRSAQEYDERRIAGSVNLPLDLIGRIAAVAPDKESAVIVYCLSGARAARAGNQLRNMGYTHVYNLGGIASWPFETIRGKEGIQ